MEQNKDLVCALCGNEDFPGYGTNSAITLAAGYGSEHDTERVTIPLCGECFDKLFAEFAARISVQYSNYKLED